MKQEHGDVDDIVTAIRDAVAVADEDESGSGPSEPDLGNEIPLPEYEEPLDATGDDAVDDAEHEDAFPARRAKPPAAPIGPTFAWSETTEHWTTGFGTMEAARLAARDAGHEQVWLGEAIPLAPDPLAIAVDLLDAMGYGNLAINNAKRKKLGEVVIRAVGRRIGPPVRMNIQTLANLTADAPADVVDLGERVARGDYRGRDALVARDLARLVPHPADALLRTILEIGAQRVVETFTHLQPTPAEPQTKEGVGKGGAQAPHHTTVRSTT